MVIVLKEHAEKEKIESLSEWLSGQGVRVHPIEGTETTVLGLVGDTSAIDIDTVKLYDIVDKVMKVSEPYKRANRKFHPCDTVIELGPNVRIGENKIIVMAGPCSVESQEQINAVAETVKKSGATVLRGG
ncbi:MAG: 3-deoxy-7-phosphoheptulonate synthase, partial [Bacillota bacterium]|nr:3-deoxy-7-phosphoheptulonate synthase [Bacillota bacterium]